MSRPAAGGVAGVAANRRDCAALLVSPPACLFAQERIKVERWSHRFLPTSRCLVPIHSLLLGYSVTRLSSRGAYRSVIRIAWE